MEENRIILEAMRAIVDERARQVAVEGHMAEGDDKYVAGELALTAACYAAWHEQIYIEDQDALLEPAPGYVEAPSVCGSWEKIKATEPRRRLVIAGALILAELERLGRLEIAASSETPPRNDVES